MDNYLIAKASDVGVTRQVNEDSMIVFDSPNGQVMAVCDGMGGQAAGDVASQLAVNIIESILTDNVFETPEEAIRRSVLAANQGILNRTAQNPELEGMGSTCVMLIIKDGRVHCGWVGDSRIYYIANHTIRQISHDQSYVQQLLDSGQITAAEAAVHPQKNEITNCIGLQGMTAPDTITVPIVPEPGSVFLLCSDGLSGMVDERQIERVISNANMSLQEKADRLVALANEAGGLDNITVELVQFGTPDAAGATSDTLFKTPDGINNTKKKSQTLLYSITSFLIVVALCVGGYFYVQQQKEIEKEKEKEKKEAVNKKGQQRPSERPVQEKKKTVPPTTPSKPTSRVKPTVVSKYKNLKGITTKGAKDKLQENFQDESGASGQSEPNTSSYTGSDKEGENYKKLKEGEKYKKLLE